MPLYAPYASFIGDNSDAYWMAYLALSIAFSFGCRYVAILEVSHDDRVAVEIRIDELGDARDSASRI